MRTSDEVSGSVRRAPSSLAEMAVPWAARRAGASAAWGTALSRVPTAPVFLCQRPTRLKFRQACVTVEAALLLVPTTPVFLCLRPSCLKVA
jgi:hypothetical protein